VRGMKAGPEAATCEPASWRAARFCASYLGAFRRGSAPRSMKHMFKIVGVCSLAGAPMPGLRGLPPAAACVLCVSLCEERVVWGERDAAVGSGRVGV